MTPQQLKAMKLALEALDIAQGMLADLRSQHQPKMLSAYTALEEVLAEHAMREVQRLGQEIEQKIGCVNHDCDQCKAQPEQVIQSYSGKHNLEQEPVAWMDKYGEIYKDVPEVLSTDKPLYTSPPQRTWVNPQDEEIKILWIQYRAALPRYLCFAKALLARAMEKNT